MWRRFSRMNLTLSASHTLTRKIMHPPNRYLGFSLIHPAWIFFHTPREYIDSRHQRSTRRSLRLRRCKYTKGEAVDLTSWWFQTLAYLQYWEDNLGASEIMFCMSRMSSAGYKLGDGTSDIDSWGFWLLAIESNHQIITVYKIHNRNSRYHVEEYSPENTDLSCPVVDQRIPHLAYYCCRILSL